MSIVVMEQRRGFRGVGLGQGAIPLTSNAAMLAAGADFRSLAQQALIARSITSPVGDADFLEQLGLDTPAPTFFDEWGIPIAAGAGGLALGLIIARMASGRKGRRKGRKGRKR